MRSAAPGLTVSSTPGIRSSSPLTRLAAYGMFMPAHTMQPSEGDETGVALPIVDIGESRWPGTCPSREVRLSRDRGTSINAPMLPADRLDATRARSTDFITTRSSYFLAGCTEIPISDPGVDPGAANRACRQTGCLSRRVVGRFRLGIGVGWTEIEFVGLNENFHNRGRRSEEQVEVMQALWAEPHVSFKGKWHTIEDAGINPGSRRKIRCGMAHADATLRRCANGATAGCRSPIRRARKRIALPPCMAMPRKPGGSATIGIHTRVSAGSCSEA